MSFIVNEVADNILLRAAVNLPDVKEALAVDGLRIIFQTLAESTFRLSNKLLDIHSKTDPTSSFKPVEAISQNSDRIRMKRPINAIGEFDPKLSNRIASVMSEVWIILDNIHRLNELISFIPGETPGFKRQKLKDLLVDVKGIRDSFHHVDERIKTQFGKLGGSVFGDITWRYAFENSYPGLYILTSGVDRISPGKELYIGDPNMKIEDNNGGVFDLELRYVKQDKVVTGKSDSGKPTWQWGPLHNSSVNFDTAASVINLLYAGLCTKYSIYHSDEIIRNKVTDYLLPGIMGVRRKKPDTK